MASSQLSTTGTVLFGVGKRPHSVRQELWAGQHGEIDATIGQDDTPYINGVQQPANKGITVPFGLGPHAVEGDNLYVIYENDSTTDGLDSDDTSAVLHIPYVDYDVTTGQRLRAGVHKVADRNTDTQTGGLNDDPTCNKDVPTPVYAFGPVPPGVRRTYYGRLEVNLRDDTA